MLENPLILILFVFFGKNVELSLNSFRIIVVAKGYKNIAFVIAFIESAIWISTVAIIFKDLNNIFNILAYCLGMASGSYLGVILEKKLALGLCLIRVITQKDSSLLLTYLRKVKFRVSSVNAESNYGQVQILFAIIKRKDLNHFIAITKEFNPNAFFTTEDIREASLNIQKSDPLSFQEAIKDFKLKKESFVQEEKNN